MEISRYDLLGGGPSVNGFVCFRSAVSSNPIAITVYNPTTRQIVKLPDLTSDDGHTEAFLGYDPVEDEYKVLCVIMLESERQRQEYLVCTVSSSRKQEWRKIENTTGDNYICGESTCIGGALYYGAGQSKIARFDVRSEEIEFIKTPKEAPISIACNSALMNYNGKLGCLDYCCIDDLIMTLWVLEGVEKQEWSSMTYDLPDQWEAPTLGVGTVSTEGVIRFGVPVSFRPPFRVCYYDFNKKNTREVEIREMEKDGGLTRILGTGELTGNPGHIENIRFL